MDLASIQAALREQHLSGWLVHDFRHSNPVLARLLPAPKVRHLTRRVALVIPVSGAAKLLVSPLDAGQFKDTSGVQAVSYNGWRAFHAALGDALGALPAPRRVAMEYAPGAALPVVSVVDAGTIELVRSLGVEVVSSADVIQSTTAVWSEAGLANHRVASRKVHAIKDAAFALIRARAGAPGGPALHEHDVAGFIREAFTREGLQYPDGPIVAVNQHAGDPHYEPGPQHPTPIGPGDLVMIDLWARVPGDENLYSDITWMGCVRGSPETRRRAYDEVFGVVAAARDAALALAQDSWRGGQSVQGWELDEAAMGVIRGAGFERGIKHRTGHSLSPGASDSSAPSSR